MTGTTPLPSLLDPWRRARRRHGLNHLEVRMALGLGLDPRRLAAIGGVEGDQPGERIARLYESTFGRDRPGTVRTLEEMAARMRLRMTEALALRPSPAAGSSAADDSGRGRVVRLGVPVGLEALVKQLAHANREVLVYLDRRIGEFIPVTNEALLLTDLDDDEIARRAEPEQRAVMRLREAERDPDRYLVVPDPWAAERTHLFERFTEYVDDEDLQDALASALRDGRSAAGRVRDLIQRHGLEREWLAFEEAALVRIAREWLKAWGLPFRDDLGA